MKTNKLIKMHKELVADMYVEVQDLKAQSKKLQDVQNKAGDLRNVRHNRLSKVYRTIKGFVHDVNSALLDFITRRHSLTYTKAELKRDEINLERDELKDYLTGTQTGRLSQG